MKKTTIASKPSFFSKLWRCTKGETAEKLVIIGLAVTAAAMSGQRLIQSSITGSTAAGNRAVTGAEGTPPSAGAQ